MERNQLPVFKKGMVHHSRMTSSQFLFSWHHRLYGMSLSKLGELVMDWEAWPATIHVVAKSWTECVTELTDASIPWHWIHDVHLCAKSVTMV